MVNSARPPPHSRTDGPPTSQSPSAAVGAARAAVTSVKLRHSQFHLGVPVDHIAVHLPEPLLRLIWKVKGPDRIVGVTDAMRGAGMPDGPTVLGSIDDGMAAIIEDGVAKLPDRSSFAGSVCTTDRVVRNYLTRTGASLPEAVQVMTLTPARLMRIDDRKGSIAPGKDADIVLFDDDISVSLTMIGGRVVYRK